MLLVLGQLIWTSVVVVMSARGASSAHCPTACTCDDSVHTSLIIDCQRRITTTDDDLYDELQTFLEDKLTSSLTSLTITNTHINSIPPAICKTTSLQVRLHQYDVTTGEITPIWRPYRWDYTNMTLLQVRLPAVNTTCSLQDDVTTFKINEITSNKTGCYHPMPFYASLYTLF